MAGVQVIEFSMMDKRKYFPLTLASGTTIRSLLYPLSLIKTRLQMQRHRSLYSGLYDACKKIVANEGVRGLYRGFWVNTSSTIPQMLYITTYESVRQVLLDHTFVTNGTIRAFIAGGCASVASQTFIVPIDVVTQHLMMLGKGLDRRASKQHMPELDPLKIPAEAANSRMGATKAVVAAVYRAHGVRGFYRGYVASLLVYAPNSALWWFFYDHYTAVLASWSPSDVPRLAIQCFAAPLAGCTASILTNPLDITRTRIQVKGRGTIISTMGQLWHEEGLSIFGKALSVRLVQTSIFSFSIVLGYETVKRLSLLDEYKQDVRW